MESNQRRDERPEVMAWSETEEHAFDDIPPNTALTLVIGEDGEDSYVEYRRDDGAIRRLVTLKGGGDIRIQTARST